MGLIVALASQGYSQGKLGKARDDAFVSLFPLIEILTSLLCQGRNKTQKAKESYKAQEVERIGRFIRLPLQVYISNPQFLGKKRLFGGADYT